MALRFIVGRAGTGKTELCLNEIRSRLREAPWGDPLVLLVPEQATFQMEHALSDGHGIKGIIRAQVLSFRRLAWRILQETGGAARVPIGELGKRMVLRRLLEQSRGDFTMFAHSMDKPGFADMLARTIGEFKIYQTGPRELAEAAEKLSVSSSLLKTKLADLAQVYMSFQEYLQDRYTDPDDYLNIIARRLGRSAMVNQAEVWIDGFTGYTPQEFDVIENIIKYAARVNITLCMDPADLYRALQENDLFYPVWETYRELVRRAERTGRQIENPFVLNPQVSPRFSGNSSLAHVERKYFLYPAETHPDGRGITLTAAVNRRAEVEAAAREITFLSREKGYRWKDTALLLRDVEPYKDLVADIFRDYGIPFFMDCKRTMMHHPLVELIRSALETVIKDWAYEPLFRCLKTDLFPLNRDDIDLLENYVLAHGIRGAARWAAENWQYRQRYTLGEDAEISPEEAEVLERVNTLRQQIVGCLGGFSEAVRQSENVFQISVALYELLESLHIPDTLEKWSIGAEEAGQPALSREHRQVWGSITGLLDEMVEAIGEEPITLEGYLAVLESGLESLKLGLIPPGLDQVVIGSMDRTRNANVKALFILGANEGVLPARQADDGMFNEADRQRLEEVGLTLAAGGRRRAFDEQYLIYMALTRAEERLWLGYPLADEEGRALTPSPVVSRLKELFPGLTETFCQVDLPMEGAVDDSRYFTPVGRVLTMLAAGLRELKAGRPVNDLCWDFYNLLNRSLEGRQQLDWILRGVFHSNTVKGLSPKTSLALYGTPLRASVSRMERFNSCPFAHFAAYGLRLKERSLFRLAAPDMGEFFHAALKLFSDRLAEHKLDWGQLSRGDCSDLTGQIVEELVPQLQSEILLSTARYRYLTGKLRRTVNRAALVLAEHARQSVFRPVGVELGFGPGGQLPVVEVNLADGAQLQLVGRIDRIDAAEDGEKSYLRVIDYKSSDQKLSLAEIYHGLKLQLLTYLHVALNHSARLIGRPGHPGAVLYFTVKDPLLPSQGPVSAEWAEREMLKKLKMKGFLLGDPEVIKMMDDSIQSGSSLLLPVALNKDGNFRANAPVISGGQFDMLRCYLEQVFAQAGNEILHGNVSISPFKMDKATACTFCLFKAVCQFDLLLEGNNYRILSDLDSDEIWQQLAKGEVE